jgi:hypothetical protein
VKLESTHIKALEYVSLDVIADFAHDAPRGD